MVLKFLIEQLRTVNKNQMTDYIGRVSYEILAQVDIALSKTLGSCGGKVKYLCNACRVKKMKTNFIRKIDPFEKATHYCSYCDSKLAFKTITVDNGVEFADFENMEKSIFNKDKKRTSIFYCHPYSSWERGSNENQNKLIRRHIPKGYDFDDKPHEEIQKIQDWINNYPRRKFNYMSSNELFEFELSKIFKIS